jgi:proline iminopeptidase
VVLGHSHRGFVALELAARNPRVLGGVIAYDTAPCDNAELRAEATRQMAAFVQRWPDRQEAAQAGRTWLAYRVTGEAKIVDRASHLEFRRGIQPAYFAAPSPSEGRKKVTSPSIRPATTVSGTPATGSAASTRRL